MSASLSLSLNLRRLRLSRNLSQHELAEASRISRATIAAIENGRYTSARLSTIEDLASALGEPVAVLLTPASEHQAAD